MSHLESYLNDGWKRGFRKRVKTTRMNLGDLEVCVPTDLVNVYESNGFKIGAKSSRRKTFINPRTGEEVKVPKNDVNKINSLKSDGWVPKKKSDHLDSGKGMIYVYKDEHKKRINKSDLNKYLDLGYSK